MSNYEIKEFIVGQVAKLIVKFYDEANELSDPDGTITLKIIDNDNVEQVSIVEAVGALVLLEKVSKGVYCYRHTVTIGSPDCDETWEYKWKCTSSGAGTAATGTIDVLAPGAYTDCQAFTLDDGSNDPVRFELDNDGNFQSGSVVIDLTAYASDVLLADAIRTAINASGIAITAGGISPQITLTADNPGPAGNLPILVEKAFPQVVGMFGGTERPPTTAGRRRFKVLASEFPNP